MSSFAFAQAAGDKPADTTKKADKKEKTKKTKKEKTKKAETKKDDMSK
jgi:hypothetical protein